MDNLAQGKTDIKSSTDINKDKNILIDEKSKATKTNNDGYAFFNIRIFKGMPGFYTLQFQAGKLQGDQSSIIKLLNKIDTVKLLNDISQKIKINLENGSEKITLSV